MGGWGCIEGDIANRWATEAVVLRWNLTLYYCTYFCFRFPFYCATISNSIIPKITTPPGKDMSTYAKKITVGV